MVASFQSRRRQQTKPPASRNAFPTGRALDGKTRSFMESRFGHDFSKVRIHPDAAIAGHGVRAYTAGREIHFGRGRYAPHSPHGQRLLAHELAHVVQQSGRRTSVAPAAAAEREAAVAASSVVNGLPVSVSTGRVVPGTPQFEDGSAAGHPGGKLPTPEEYVKSHTNVLGLNLQENKLASNLYLLAWQSSGHYDFVLNVFRVLDTSNQQEVAQAFFVQLVGDSWLKELALTARGRAFLTSVAGYLPEKSGQRRRVEKIIAAGPQAEREKERNEAIEALEKKGKTVDITFYTDYKGMDAAETVLGTIAKSRLENKKTDAAFPMEQFDDIHAYLGAVSKKYGGAADFVRELHLMGHGTENNFGFGRHYYNSEYLRDNHATGENADFMADGGTIYMEGCNVAKGEAGKAYLKEVGRIFFGDKKTGYIKGNTCVIFGIGELTECGPRTLRWPGDFK